MYTRMPIHIHTIHSIKKSREEIKGDHPSQLAKQMKGRVEVSKSCFVGESLPFHITIYFLIQYRGHDIFAESHECSLCSGPVLFLTSLCQFLLKEIKTCLLVPALNCDRPFPFLFLLPPSPHLSCSPSNRIHIKYTVVGFRENSTHIGGGGKPLAPKICTTLLADVYLVVNHSDLFYMSPILCFHLFLFPDAELYLAVKFHPFHFNSLLSIFSSKLKLRH